MTGALFGEPIVGWWSERAHRLTFVLSRDREDAADDLAFEAYAWDEPGGLGVPRLYHLAGSYETFGGGGGAKDRQTFGWFATLERPGPTRLDERSEPSVTPVKAIGRGGGPGKVGCGKT